MALVALKEFLEDAVRSRYAVGGFDAGEHGFAEAIIQAAEETKAPVILMVPEPFLKYIDSRFKFDTFSFNGFNQIFSTISV